MLSQKYNRGIRFSSHAVGTPGLPPIGSLLSSKVFACPMPSDDTVRHYKDQLDGDENIEDTVQQLRQDGHSRKEAVQILLDMLDLSLVEAKRVLATSTTWADAFDERDDGPAPSSSSVPPAPG